MQTTRTAARLGGLDTLAGIDPARRTGQRLSRRGFLRGLGRGLGAAALTAVLPASRTLAGEEDRRQRDALKPRQQPGERGLGLLRALALGQLRPYSLPGADWPIYVDRSGAHVLNHPPAWEIQEIADDDGAGGSHVGAWVVAPDRSAAMSISTLLTYQNLLARDVAMMTLKELANGEDISLIHDDNVEVDGASGTFAAAEFDGVLAAVNVTVGLNPMASGSVVRFSIALGETSVFDEATEQVFLPFFFQFISGGRSGGGGADPDDEDGEDSESGAGEPGDVVNPGSEDEEE